MPDFFFIYILLIHHYGDFAMQTDAQAKGKSEGSELYNKHLFQHVGIYCITWFLAIYAITISIPLSFIFAIITFICHYTTDWITSRIGKPFWTKGDTHFGFVTVGYDQIFHYIQLWYTMKLLHLF